MAKLTNPEVARIFANIATALEIDGANPFRVRAYREAARVVESHPVPMASLARAEKGLEGIPGIGKDLAQKIRDIVSTGTTPTWDELREKYPEETIELTSIPGVGPKRVKVLFETLGVRKRADLERVAHEGKIRTLPRFGQGIEQNILKGLATHGAAAGGDHRLLLHGAWNVAHEMAGHIARVAGVEAVEIAGSFRRRKETVGDLDLVVSGGNAETVMDAFVRLPQVAEVLGRGDTKSSVRLGNGLQVDLRVVPAESFGAALLYFTGSKAHNIELRRIAIDRGLLLNEYGLFRGEERLAGRTEQEVYRALELDWIPPEMRESLGEIELAAAGRLPRLVELKHMRGDLHMHTDRTDGTESLESMVRAARERGYEYCAITDHSKALAMTGGFDAARVRQSVDEIAAVRREVPGIEVLHGLEVDILADGSLDLDDESLALLDWVIISLHSHLTQDRSIMTERVLKAISHPAVHMMGHPMARRISSRPPVPMDMERVLDRAAECHVAMEINAQPDRLDLDDVNARAARERGIPLIINTDAHSFTQMDFMAYGVFMARRAWCEPGHILNTRDLAGLRRWLPRRGQAPTRQAAKPPVHKASEGASRASKPAPRPAAAKPRVASGARKTGRRASK